jgi:outer membrane biosynthesis protein TonB
MDMVVIGRPLETYETDINAQYLPAGGKPFLGHVGRTADTNVPAILWSQPHLLPDAVADRLKEETKEKAKGPRVRPPALDLAKEESIRSERKKFLAEITEVALQPSRNRQVILETGSLGPPMAEMDKCSEDSLKDWGVDPAVEKKVVRPVWSINPNGWLFESDYPRELINQGAESVIEVRLLVDAAGKVTKCTPLSHYEQTEFNKITCARIAERARFEPAELANGTKVPSYVTRRVFWRIARR